MPLYRPHRELLADAMREVQSWETRADLERIVAPFKLVSVEPYGGFDARIGWNTYIVTVMTRLGTSKIHPIGFTNAPLPQDPA